MESTPTFTVVLLYPDYLTGDFGADIFVEAAAAENGYAAARCVQALAAAANRDSVDDPADFRPIAVIRGDVVLELDATHF